MGRFFEGECVAPGYEVGWVRSWIRGCGRGVGCWDDGHIVVVEESGRIGRWKEEVDKK
jgi:hypothetical protein